ncbi:Integral membrane protein [Geobacillus sp. WSUCF1]|nr:Integral membrane protein [Geobacillus sp. WSUCF1]
MSRKGETFPRKSMRVEWQESPLSVRNCILYGRGDSYVVMGVHDFARFQREHGQLERRHYVWNGWCPFFLLFVGAYCMHVWNDGVCVHEHRPSVGACFAVASRERACFSHSHGAWRLGDL